VARIPKRSNTFFRLSPAEQIDASCFGVEQGKILQRSDVNFWRITPFLEERFAHALFAPVRFGELALTVQYGSSALAKLEPPGVPILRMNNLQDDGWDLSDLKYIELTDRQLETYRLYPEDIIFNRTNSKELVGKCEVFNEIGDWVFASYLIRVHTNKNLLNPQFVSDFLSTFTGRLQIDRFSRQIIGMTNINAEEIRQILIPLPPLQQQCELVAVMDEARSQRKQKLAEADTLLSSLDEFILDTLNIRLPSPDAREMYATCLSQMLGNRIDAYSNKPYFQKLFNTIQSSRHRIATLNVLSNRIFSGTTPLAKGDAYVDPPNGVRFIRSGEITSEGSVTNTSAVHISNEIHDEKMRSSKLQQGDLLIAIVGATIGAVGIYEINEPANINQAIAAVRIGSDILGEYVCWYLRSSIGQRLLDYFKRPVARANINLSEIGEIPIIFPPLEVQEHIIAEVRNRRSEAKYLRAEAQAEWQKAKRWFEEQLLGSVPL
jgi:type I restriction enzyme, S subunit